MAHFSNLGSKCEELDAIERLRILYDFFRSGEEAEYKFSLYETMRKGHNFKDYICPDTSEAINLSISVPSLISSRMSTVGFA